jgi:hypothetical protein
MFSLQILIINNNTWILSKYSQNFQIYPTLYILPSPPIPTLQITPGKELLASKKKKKKIGWLKENNFKKKMQ